MIVKEEKKKEKKRIQLYKMSLVNENCDTVLAA
jgi:hypothetical protein